MNKFYAKLAVFMAFLGVGSICTAIFVPYWSTEHQSEQGDYSLGLFFCKYTGSGDEPERGTCTINKVLSVIPHWFHAVRGLVVACGVLAATIFLLLIVYICRVTGNQRKIMTTIICTSFLTAAILLTAIIVSALEFDHRDAHLAFGWAYGLAIGTTVDFAIIAVPLCFERQTIRNYETL